MNRITLLACIHASGDVGRPMFVLKGTRMRYRKYLSLENPVEKYLETIADCLPRGSLVATRKDVAGVDKANFVQWSRRIVEDLKCLTANGRKELLLYDGYRSHMCLEALEMFKANGIIGFTRSYKRHYTASRPCRI